MGPRNSKVLTSAEIANEFVTNVVSSSVSNNNTIVRSSQNINISCSEAVAMNAATLCAQEKMSLQPLIMMDPAPISEKLAYYINYRPPVCDTCLVQDVSNDMGITITLEDIQSNNISTGILGDLTSAIDKKIQEANTGTVNASNTNTTALTKIKNSIATNFNHSSVNNVLKTFNFDQNISITNAKAKNISQKLVVNAVASSIVSSLFKADTGLKQAVADAVSSSNTNTGVVQGVAEVAGKTIDNAVNTAGKTLDNAVNNAANTANNAIDTVGDTADNALNFAKNMIYIYILVGLVVAFMVYKTKLYCAIPIFTPFCATGLVK